MWEVGSIAAAALWTMVSRQPCCCKTKTCYMDTTELVLERHSAKAESKEKLCSPCTCFEHMQSIKSSTVVWAPGITPVHGTSCTQVCKSSRQEGGWKYRYWVCTCKSQLSGTYPEWLQRWIKTRTKQNSIQLF